MSRERPRNIAASVADPLLQRARQTGEEHQLLLTRFGLEHLMYRLSESPARDRFVVKGALLFLVWAEESFRATRDPDLLAMREPSPQELLELFRGLGDVTVVEDGLVFDPATVEVSEIREDQQYGGLRVTMRARLGKIVIPIQVDIGFGDAVTPEPKAGPFPVLLDFPPPILRLYPRETVVAEKFDAMEQLGLLNSRMKDYYDLWIVARQYAFDGELLCQAVRNTFRRRKTDFPAGEPEGLSEAYATDRAKNAQWAAFARRARLRAGPRGLKEAIELLRRFLLPVLEAARQNTAFSSHWPPGRHWHSR